MQSQYRTALTKYGGKVIQGILIQAFRPDFYSIELSQNYNISPSAEATVKTDGFELPLSHLPLPASSESPNLDKYVANINGSPGNFLIRSDDHFRCYYGSTTDRIARLPY